MAERKSDLAFAAFFGSGKSGGGGGSVTVDAALSASSENPVQNKVINAALAAKGTYSKPSGGIPKSDLSSAVQTSLGKADTAVQAETVVEVSGTTPTITPANNTIYNCGELTSLTIINPTATGAYSIVFTSGSTATDLSIPQTLLMPDGFSVEANRLYEINVLANRAVVGSWAVSA